MWERILNLTLFFFYNTLRKSDVTSACIIVKKLLVVFALKKYCFLLSFIVAVYYACPQNLAPVTSINPISLNRNTTTDINHANGRHPQRLFMEVSQCTFPVCLLLPNGLLQASGP